MNARWRKTIKALVRRTLHLLCWPLPAAGPRVLCFHSVDRIDSPISVTPELFARQMDWLVRKRYTTWTTSRFVAALRARERLPRKLVVLTFDDGYRNNVEQALPILEARGLCATVFLVTGNAGDVPRWGERDQARIREMIWEVYPGSDADKERAYQQSLATLDERIATWEELAGVPERGLEIQSHGRTHRYMDRLDEATLHEELEGARADLAAHGLGDGATIAWPYGAWSEAAIAAAERAGYRGTFLGEPSWERRKHPDPLRIARISIEGENGVFGMAFQLGAGYDAWTWLKRLRRRGNRAQAKRRPQSGQRPAAGSNTV